MLFVFFWEEAQCQCDCGVIVSKCQDLDDESQFIDAPLERLVFKDIDYHLVSDFPNTVAHLAIKSKNGTEFLRIASAGNPLGLATGFEVFLRVASHHIDRSFFSCSSKSEKISDFRVDFIALEQSSFSTHMLFKVVRVEHKETFKVRQVTVGLEKIVEEAVEAFWERRDMKHFLGAVSGCHPMVSQRIWK